MSRDEVKEFFSNWYGKIVLACLTALAVAVTIAVARVPLNDRNYWTSRITANQSEQAVLRREMDAFKAEINTRLGRMETNIDWLVRNAGGSPK